MRYVYRKFDDVPARPNANKNVVGLGVTLAPTNDLMCPAWGCDGPPRFIDPFAGQPSHVVIGGPVRPWFPIFRGAPGVYVPQTPPGQVPGWIVASQNPPATAPAPAPTVAVPPSQTAPSLTTPGTTLSTTGASTGAWTPNTYYSAGQAIVDAAGHTQQVTVAGMSGPNAPNFNDIGGSTSDGSVVWSDTGAGGAATAGLMAWFSESTLISGIPNWGIAAAAGVALMLMMKRK